MEFRKEKNEKSKEIIRKQFQSDIFNISTGYYKTENILPITAKPNEYRDKMKEFVPKYKEIKPSLRLFNDLLSHRQKRSLSVRDLRPNLTRQNSEVQISRHYNKLIKENCFDDNGNFSAKKRYQLEFYGKEKINNITLNKSFNTSIKDKRNKSLRRILTSSNLFMRNDSENTKRRTISCKNINMKYPNNKNLLQTPRKNSLSISDFKSPQNDNSKSKTNININKIDKKFSNIKSPIKGRANKKLTNEKKNFGHQKVLENEFYTKPTHPVKSNRISKEFKEDNDKDYYNIEIKNDNDKGPLIDQKKLKQIFLKNGLHLYDFNEDGMNDLFYDKKFEAKLRKNKKDENFDRNYRNVVRELNKINVKINRCGIVNDTGFLNNKAQRKRKGTPGKNLIKNKENKDENTKLNRGFGLKRDKYIQPQQNKDYKNGYNYKIKYFNHNKK